jgi:hypothetical protein
MLSAELRRGNKRQRLAKNTEEAAFQYPPVRRPWLFTSAVILMMLRLASMHAKAYLSIS